MEEQKSYDEEKYQKAKKRIEEIKGFYVHLASYVVVMIFLFLVNIITSPGELWFFWPMLGWGIGVSIHAFTIFGVDYFFGDDWEERKIKEFLDKDK